MQLCYFAMLLVLAELASVLNPLISNEQFYELVPDSCLQMRRARSSHVRKHIYDLVLSNATYLITTIL
jgi:hypothetical protein